ncbi:putative chromatin regulator PHD family [Senna tora]|uniref:Putative chromatin regulator PHD family n=1 Tax=Senna tora TaxID=362788 RepID=A0A834TQK4_9FABA|nr:putative chromatin regulator PHD family [Senna tora]
MTPQFSLFRYCLRGPVIFDDDIIWLCEDCEATVNPPCGTSNDVKLAKNTVQARLEIKNKIKRVKKKNRKKQKTMKKQKETEDISGFVGKTKVPSSDCYTSHHDQTQCNVPLSNCHASPAKTQCSDNFEDCEKLVKQCGPVLEDTANSNKESDSLKNSEVTMNDDSKIVELDSCAEAQPIADPIWRGSLLIRDQSIGKVDGLVAHVSSLACSKVLDETNQFPRLLLADLLERSVVWPTGFKESGPTDESIALYFLPETERDEKIFDKLVHDIISDDLALRVIVENAELLVFPSTVLPTQSWRFQAKYYLWGVFRGRQASKTKNDVL